VNTNRAIDDSDCQATRLRDLTSFRNDAARMAQAWFKLAESADLMDLAESDDAIDHDEAYFRI
jgi:hypothetical protein